MKVFGFFSFIFSILIILFVFLKHIRNNKKELNEQLYQQIILAYKQITKVIFDLYYFVFKTFNVVDFNSLLDAARELIELFKREIGFQILSDDTVNRIVELLSPFQIFKNEYIITRMK